MPTDIATWLEQRRVRIAPIDRSTIVGVGHAIESLEGVLARLREPRRGTVAPRGLLLTGPSGTGKTLCARWLAGSLGAIPAYDLPPDALTPRRVREAFAHLADQERSVLFLPEIDAVGRAREWVGHSQPTRRILFALLEAMDGLAPIAPERGPLIIATSNRLHSLEPALVRPLRLGTSIVFGLPDAEERVALLATFLRDRLAGPIDLRFLAELTREWSPATLRAAVDEADGYALARGGPTEPVTEADCLLAIRRASVRQREPVTEGDGAAGLWRSAVHEAGHAVVAVRLGQPVASIRLTTSGLGGSVEAGLEGAIRDDATMRASVVIGMGGIAAERLLLTEPGPGSRDDVRNATRTLLARIENGIDQDFPPVDRSAFGEYGSQALDQLLVDRILPALETARMEATAIVVSGSATRSSASPGSSSSGPCSRAITSHGPSARPGSSHPSTSRRMTMHLRDLLPRRTRSDDRPEGMCPHRQPIGPEDPFGCLECQLDEITALLDGGDEPALATR